MTISPELQKAIRQYRQWFGSYKVSGELKKILVWLHEGRIEFLTELNSYKAKRGSERLKCARSDSSAETLAQNSMI